MESVVSVERSLLVEYVQKVFKKILAVPVIIHFIRPSIFKVNYTEFFPIMSISNNAALHLESQIRK